MKRARSPSFDATSQPEKQVKVNYLDESNCWESLPFELRDRITRNLHQSRNLNLVRYSSHIDDQVLRYIAERFTSVQKLTIGKIGVNMPITEQGMSCLSNLTKLQCLNLIDLYNTQKTLANHLPSVVSLNMTWCTVHDHCVAHFSLFKNLRHLSLQDSAQVTDTGLVQLASMVHLVSLNLSFCCGITDLGIVETVAKLHNLESLNLSWCSEVTDFSLVHIGAKLRRLRILYLTGCKKISMDGKNFIRRNLPECKVYSDSNFIPFKLGTKM